MSLIRLSRNTNPTTFTINTPISNPKIITCYLKKFLVCEKGTGVPTYLLICLFLSIPKERLEKVVPKHKGIDWP